MFKKSALPAIILTIPFLVVFSAKAYAAEVTMSLDPATATVAKDSTQTVKVMLNSGTQEITAGDVYLEYDSSKVQITQANVSKGEQDYNYGAGTCDFRLKGTVVDSSKVRFGFSCEDDQGLNQPFTGSVHVGSVLFTVLVGSGSTNLTLKFTPGATAGDCNAAKDGVDYLTGTSGGTYTFTSGGGNETHLVCNTSNQCVSVSGAGTNECTANSDCEEDAPTHNECNTSNVCVSVSGAGTNECTANSDCATEEEEEEEDDTDTTTTTTTTSTSTYSTTSKGATGSAVPQTAGNVWLTILGGLGSLGLILLAVLVF